MPSIKYKALAQYLDDARGRHPETVYLIFGEEFLRQKVLETLVNQILPDAQKRMNYEGVDGDNERMIKSRQDISTHPFCGRSLFTYLTSRPFDVGLHQKPCVFFCSLGFFRLDNRVGHVL